MTGSLPDFQPPLADDDHDRKLLSDVESVGWHVLCINGDASGPAYCFSVGLYYTFKHPEILVIGLEHPVANKLINLAGGYISQGKIYDPELLEDDLLEGFSCAFIPISIENYQKYFGYAIWFYRQLKQPFPAIQLVWPDKQGRFPWERGYNEQFSTLQPLL